MEKSGSSPRLREWEILGAILVVLPVIVLVGFPYLMVRAAFPDFFRRQDARERRREVERLSRMTCPVCSEPIGLVAAETAEAAAFLPRPNRPDHAIYRYRRSRVVEAWPVTCSACGFTAQFTRGGASLWCAPDAKIL